MDKPKRRRLTPGQSYSGRRPDVAVINLSMLRDDVDLIRHYSGGKKTGVFVAGLVREYHGRQLERARLQGVIGAAFEDVTPQG